MRDNVAADSQYSIDDPFVAAEEVRYGGGYATSSARVDGQVVAGPAVRAAAVEDVECAKSLPASSAAHSPLAYSLETSKPC